MTTGSVPTEPNIEADSDRRQLLGNSIPIDRQTIRQLKTRRVATVSVCKRDVPARSASAPQRNMKIAPDHEFKRITIVTEFTKEVERDVEAIPAVKIDPVPLSEKW